MSKIKILLVLFLLSSIAPITTIEGSLRNKYVDPSEVSKIIAHTYDKIKKYSLFNKFNQLTNTLKNIVRHKIVKICVNEENKIWAPLTTDNKNSSKSIQYNDHNTLMKIFPVGYFHDVIHGSTFYNITIHYPATKNGYLAKPSENNGTFPGVVFAHGLFCSKDDYTWLANYTASKGYVVVAFTSTRGLDSLNPLASLEKSEDATRKCLDYLQNNSMVDSEKIGVIGHSLGGMTVLKIAAEDIRVKTCISLAPYYSSLFTSIIGDYFESCSKINVPTQIICGSKDFICPPSQSIEYYNFLNGSKEFIVINGSMHLVELMDLNEKTEPVLIKEMMMLFGFNNEEYRNLETKYMMNWLNYYLYDDENSYKYIYGDDIKEDLKTDLLTDLKYSV